MSASGLTFLQIINRVLSRLREAEVAAYNTTIYSTFIGTIVNQVKAEIEDAFHWNSMRDTYAVTTTSGTATYALVGAGMNAVILDGWNTTTNGKLTPGTNADFNQKFFGTATVQTGNTQQYIAAGFDANYDLKVDIWPSPTATTNALKFNVYVPQADLAASATVPLCPQSVLIEETIARALLERGDEGAAVPQGPPGSTFIRADLLSSAIAREDSYDPSESDWQAE